MNTTLLDITVTDTRKRKLGWKQWLVRYGGLLPDSLVWVPESLDADMWIEFMRDLQRGGA